MQTSMVTDIWKNKLFLSIVILILHSDTGYGLECFICHDRQEKVCSDPFHGNKTDIIDCKRVRDVGLGVMSADKALGASVGQYSVLAEPPHVCFKLALGHSLTRGCGKPDLCLNYTETECQTCGTDGCNGSWSRKPLSTAILISPILCSYLKF